MSISMREACEARFTDEISAYVRKMGKRETRRRRRRSSEIGRENAPLLFCSFYDRPLLFSSTPARGDTAAAEMLVENSIILFLSSRADACCLVSTDGYIMQRELPSLRA